MFVQEALSPTKLSVRHPPPPSSSLALTVLTFKNMVWWKWFGVQIKKPQPQTSLPLIWSHNTLWPMIHKRKLLKATKNRRDVVSGSFYSHVLSVLVVAGII